MSGTLRERSRKGGEDSGIGFSNKDDSDDKYKKGRGIKVKKVSFSFRKVNSKIRQLGCFGNSISSGGGIDGKCCLCLKNPMTLGSASESPTSDPNSSEFGYDMLRGLIEKNNFYDKECNTHLVSDFDVFTQVPSPCCSLMKEK